MENIVFSCRVLAPIIVCSLNVYTESLPSNGYMRHSIKFYLKSNPTVEAG
jgi:hypothetical protein